MTQKIVPGTARKVEDIKRLYEMALARVSQRGRLTEQGREYTQMLNEVMDTMGITNMPFQVAVEYIREVTGITDSKKLASSLRAFLKTNAAKANFRTYQDGRTLIIERAH